MNNVLLNRNVLKKKHFTMSLNIVEQIVSGFKSGVFVFLAVRIYCSEIQ